MMLYCRFLSMTAGARFLLANKNPVPITPTAVTPTIPTIRYGKEAKGTDGTDQILKSGSQSARSYVMHPTVTIATAPSLSTSSVPTLNAETPSPTLQSLLCFNTREFPSQLQTLSEARDSYSEFAAKPPYQAV